MTRRIAITGMGAVTPLGNDLPTSWANVVAGRSGVGPITHFDTQGYRTTIAAELKGFDPHAHFATKDLRRLDPFAQYALVAAREAVRSSGLALEVLAGRLATRTAVIVGSGIGGVSTLSEQLRVLLERGPTRVSPYLIPMILPESAASMVAIEFGLRGPNMSVTSACATSANAIGEAAAMIRRDACDVALCGGSEAGIIPISVAGFSAMRALSERNDDPERASRPFDRDRDGFVVGEGAAILVLEEWEHAHARGASPLAELVGYASTDDAYHITAPEENGIGATECMRLALAAANLAPSDVDYINAHGTGTPLNDVTETRAIKAVFGAAAYRIPISSTKSVTGHLLGAAGALEAALCVCAIRDSVAPPTMNLDHPDPACDLDYVPLVARSLPMRVVLSNSFGFGGHNVTLIFAHPQEA